jgi:hypothetical protein
MKTTQIQFRCSDTDKARYEAAAKVAGFLSLSEWLRSLADAAAKDATIPAAKPTHDKNVQVPFNPAGPAVETVPVKQRKSKKAAAGPAVIEVEAATVCPKVAEPATIGGGAPGAGAREYTGESAVFNGTLMYECRRSGGRTSWTKEPPPQK